MFFNCLIIFFFIKIRIASHSIIYSKIISNICYIMFIYRWKIFSLKILVKPSAIFQFIITTCFTYNMILINRFIIGLFNNCFLPITFLRMIYFMGYSIVLYCFILSWMSHRFIDSRLIDHPDHPLMIFICRFNSRTLLPIHRKN